MKINRFFLIGLFISIFMISSVYAVTNDAQGGYELDNDVLMTDVSGNGNDLTNNGATSGAQGIVNQGFSFDGTNDYGRDVSLFNFPYTQNATVSLWYNWTSLTDGDGLFSLGSDAVGDFNMRLFYFGGSMYASVIKDGTGSTDKQVSTTSGDTVGQYYHAVLTYNGDTKVLEFFLDGSSVGTNTFTDTTSGTGDDFIIGAYAVSGAPSSYGNAIIDEVYVYNRVLTSAEIAELYNSGSGYQPYASSPSSDTLTINAKDIDDASSINTFNATLPYNATAFTTTNGTIYMHINNSGGNDNELQNVSVWAENYFNQTFYNQNISYTLIANLTKYPEVRVFNEWDGTQLSSFTVEYAGQNYSSTGSVAYIPANESANITIYKNNYINRTVEHNFTNYADLNTTLWQNDINFTTSEVYTNNAFNIFNITLDNGTIYQTTNGTINLRPNSDTNLSFSVSGYFIKNITYSPSTPSETTFNQGNFSNATLRINAIQTQDTSINISSFTVEFNPNGTDLTFSTTNYWIEIETLTGLNYTYNFSSTGYFNHSQAIEINSTETVHTQNLSLSGGVLLRFRDSVTTNLITGSLTLNVENDTSSTTYTFTGGTQVVDELIENKAFDLYFYGSGYQTNSYFLNYTGQAIIDLYLINGTDNVTYNLFSESGDSLQDVLITVEKFLNGSWTEISSQLTDVTGVALFGLERGLTHRITFQKDGYVDKVDVSRLPETSYVVVLQEQSEFDFDLGFQFININYLPKVSKLNASSGQFFEVNITSTGGNIEFVFAEISINGTVLGSDNVSSNSGAQMNFTLDLSAYNDSLLVFEYGLKLNNSDDLVSYVQVYKITNQTYYTGTLFELQDRLSDSLTTPERIGLYAIVFFVSLIFVSIFVTGMPSIVIAMFIATVAGWVFGVNLILLGFITAVILLFAIAFGEGAQ